MSVASTTSCLPDLCLQYNVLQSAASRDMIDEYHTRASPQTSRKDNFSLHNVVQRAGDFQGADVGRDNKTHDQQSHPVNCRAEEAKEQTRRDGARAATEMREEAVQPLKSEVSCMRQALVNLQGTYSQDMDQVGVCCNSIP